MRQSLEVAWRPGLGITTDDAGDGHVEMGGDLLHVVEAHRRES